MECPNCNRAIGGDADECPHCGVIVAKFKGSRDAARRGENAVPEREDETAKRSSRPVISKGFIVSLVVIAVTTGMIVWFYWYGPCGTKRVGTAIRNLEELARRWDDAKSVAESAPRITLAVPVSNLQEIKQQTYGLKVPICLRSAQTSLVSSMDSSIEAYLGFMQQRNELLIQTSLLEADAELSSFRSELNEIVTCAPFCSDR